MNDVATSLDTVHAAFPAWTCWQSDRGRWWATRKGTITQQQMNAGCSATVDADTLDDLAEVLAEQEQLRERP